ncbi:hypothetical protein SPF06_08050 [Sinomonas sp. JGH33]|uniref:CTP synthetase n=1 Tax=Sinomonas terricola TaxID=3110330 RepID=A0ABU5T4S9_9MICC|nr:hypothetical protein [Sinomonas sp. JGH33]MEA5454669.1 hypothetical protein [Sinomonas sp. JGH33]
MKLNPKHYIGTGIAAGIAAISFVVMIFENGEHILVKSLAAIAFAAISAILIVRGIAKARSGRTTQDPL